MEKVYVSHGEVDADSHYAVTQMHTWGDRLDAGVNHQKENPHVVTMDLPTEGNAGMKLYLPENPSESARYEAWIGDDGNTYLAYDRLSSVIQNGLDSEPDWQSLLEPEEDEPEWWDDLRREREKYEDTEASPVTLADENGLI